MMKVFHNNAILNTNANRVGEQLPKTNVNANTTSGKQLDFKDVLNNRISDKLAENTEIQFSKHANMRLNARDIILSNEQLQRLSDGIDRAREKGIKDSLVLVDNVALVVNVKSKIVITAMHNGNDNVFTNIDGAVIV